MPREVIGVKRANALFKGAAVHDTYARPDLVRAMRFLHFVYGGLWVGGNLLLFEDGLEFHPNSRNFQLHKPGSIGTIAFPLSAETKVSMKYGMVTNIISVTDSARRLVFRCHGAKAFAKVIADGAARMKAARA